MFVQVNSLYFTLNQIIKRMTTAKKTKITIEAIVNAPLANVWDTWILPEHITQWNAASDDWHCPSATNDLRVGGKFNSRMEAKDGSFGFDFGGVYDQVKKHQIIAYTMEDGRKVRTEFIEDNDQTKVVSVFEAEDENPIDMQRDGWQSILNNFKRYTESKK